MSKPIIAVVGRPNVGKSTLFNKLIGRRLSIVDDTPGVTRDRIFGDAEWLGKKFMLIDTGGIEPKTDDIILKKMRAQAELAIDTADVIIGTVSNTSSSAWRYFMRASASSCQFITTSLQPMAYASAPHMRAK